MNTTHQLYFDDSFTQTPTSSALPISSCPDLLLPSVAKLWVSKASSPEVAAAVAASAEVASAIVAVEASAEVATVVAVVASAEVEAASAEEATVVVVAASAEAATVAAVAVTDHLVVFTSRVQCSHVCCVLGTVYHQG